MPQPSNPSGPGDYSHIPIPTYEEAVSSRPSSSQRNYLGPSEVSHDAERQGLLGQVADGGGTGGGGSSSRDASRYRGYQPPTVESARSSLDDLDRLVSDDEDGAGSARASMEELRREMSEMEFEDSGRVNGRSKWSARSFASALNINIRIPSRLRAALPSWEAVRSVLPQPPSRELLTHLRLDVGVVIRILALTLIIGMAYLVFFSDILRSRTRQRRVDVESIRSYMRGAISAANIRDNLAHVTKFDHIAGTKGSYFLGKWIEDEWKNWGMRDVAMEQFDVYLNYPNAQGRSISIIDPPELQWSAGLIEAEGYPGGGTQAAVFHGHSANGNATGHLVYANYGSTADFQKLKDLGVKVEGSITMMRYGGTEQDRALKVKNAEINGARAAIIYSDPADQDADLPPFDGRWRFDDAVQRGTVSNMAMVIGDVLSPGFASTPEEKNRFTVDHAKELGYLPKIPSLPCSWSDAQRLLQGLKGVGKHLPDDAPDFVGGVPYVDWWSGGEGSPTVTLENQNDEALRQPIYNVIGQIPGDEQPNAKIIVGNHRDAWCFGAVDPGSGTAVMMEVVRVFNDLLRATWRPSRTIEFISWDAEEYNMIGSTEHVEKHIEELRKNGYAYVNLDAAVFGSKLHARASPVMQRAFYRALEHVWDEKANATLREIWDSQGSQMEGLGAGSDFVAFQDLAGVSSIDMGMSGSSYPYHSCHDTFDLMSNIFDPDFEQHRLMANVMAFLILELAETRIMPFDFEAYAIAMKGYLQDLTKYADQAGGDAKVDFGPLSDAIGVMAQAAETFRQWEQGWEAAFMQYDAESPAVAAERVEHNKRAAAFEKDLLDAAGLPGREQFKHVVFSPSISQGYEAVFFASIREPIDRKDWDAAQAAISKVAGLVTQASKNLVHLP